MRVRRLLMIFGICSVLVFLLGAQIYLVLPGWGEPISFGLALLMAAPDWYPWVALAPMVLWLADKAPLAAPTLRRNFAIHILAAFTTAALYVFLNLALEALSYRLQGQSVDTTLLLEAVFLTKFMVGIVVYGGIVAFRMAIDYRRRYQERALKASQLEKGLAEARLRSLEMQLHPHFLFNTLNAISSLMHQDVDAADRMIIRLATLLRYTLEAGDVQLVTLEDELEILRKYMAIEEARFGERLTITLDVPREISKAQVPILLLQPLVENAIRHGVSPRRGPGHINVQACRRGEVLHIEVVDDGVGLPPGWTLARACGGVGLSNTRERLSGLFGDGACLTIKGRRGQGVRVAMTLPYTQGQGSGARQAPEGAGGERYAN